MNLKNLSESLNSVERKVLQFLSKFNAFEDIVKATGLKEVEVMRALQWLENKNIVTLTEAEKEFVALDENGKLYSEIGLPEKRFLQSIKENSTISEISKKSKLSDEELSVCLGILKSKSAISVAKSQKNIIISITAKGKELLAKGLFEENFLEKNFPIELKSLKNEDKLAFESLIKRKKILKIDRAKKVYADLTDLGKEISNIKVNDEYIEKLTPAMLKTGAWKGRKFRRFDVEINVPSIFCGKSQHYRDFLDMVRSKFLALGFKEMFGPIVETDFWNMDALFMPQFHSARDIHQGYYIKEPKYTRELPKDKVNNVRLAHENGFETGSKGWQYEFDVQRTYRHILRTHDTSISARTLASKDLKIPGKYFQIARCFRYDVIDATHLPDFNQVGGFVIQEDIDFRHLKGLLKMFAEEFADTETIRIKPSYFPFTEPSAELQAKHPEFGWMELAGSGIFRPELVKPLVGKEVPVIAWGVGLDRLAMFKLGINDIRQLFSNDLEFLRRIIKKIYI